MAAKQPKGVIVMDTETPELLASAIEDVAKAAKLLLSSRLSNRAIVLLIKDKTSLPMADIQNVLVAASQLGSFIRK